MSRGKKCIAHVHSPCALSCVPGRPHKLITMYSVFSHESKGWLQIFLKNLLSDTFTGFKILKVYTWEISLLLLTPSHQVPFPNWDQGCLENIPALQEHGTGDDLPFSILSFSSREVAHEHFSNSSLGHPMVSWNTVDIALWQWYKSMIPIFDRMSISVPTMFQMLLSNDWPSQGLMSTEQDQHHLTNLCQLDVLMHFSRAALGNEGQMPSWKISLGYKCWQSKGRKASTRPGASRFWVPLTILVFPSFVILETSVPDSRVIWGAAVKGSRRNGYIHVL